MDGGAYAGILEIVYRILYIVSRIKFKIFFFLSPIYDIRHTIYNIRGCFVFDFQLLLIQYTTYYIRHTNLMTPDKTYLSQDKYEKLKEELEYLTTVRRREVAEKLEYAKSLGDLSENSEYQEAREDQSSTEERIAKVESLLRSAEVISHETREAGDSISIGSKVTLKREDGEREDTYEIVGEEEADLSQKRISNKSPIGAATIGKKKGDEIAVRTPSGEVKYKIVKVE